jgi:energy-converting hydrogenase Eha subunit G
MPLTAALFLVMAGTGVMLFLQWSPSTVRIAHEWLGLAFLAAALWHLIHHWRGFQNALMRRPTQVTIALVLLGAGLLIALTAHEPGSGEGRHRHWSEGPPAFSAPISLPEDEQSVS